MADAHVNPLDRLDPELALRPGDIDPHVVLLLWCLRKTFYPLLWTGLSVGVIVLGDVDALGRELEGLDTPQAMLSSLLSPFGIIVLAFGLRILVGFTGLLAAYPLTLGRGKHHYAGNSLSRWFHLWWDRLYQARAYRALRQTWSVRQHAHRRLGVAARIYRTCELILSWANAVLLVAFVVIVGLVAGPATG